MKTALAHLVGCRSTACLTHHKVQLQENKGCDTTIEDKKKGQNLKRTELGLGKGTRFHSNSILLHFQRLAMEINIGHLRDKTLGGQAGELAGSTAPEVFLSACNQFEVLILGAKCQNHSSSVNVGLYPLAPSLSLREFPSARIETECDFMCGLILA